MFTLFRRCFSNTRLPYAEIHYRVPGFPSLIHRRQPEIILDAPLRLEPDRDLPVSLIIKDAHHFPASLKHLQIRTEGGFILLDQDLDKTVSDLIFSRIFTIPSVKFMDYRGFMLTLKTELTCIINGKERRIRTHNYRQLGHRHLDIFIAKDPLPGQENCSWSDCHIHSFQTHDQVEFGAPVNVLSRSARAMGLSCLCITDHSYDLDDIPGEYVKPDPDLTRWHKLKKEIDTDDNGMILIRGEEVSCANSSGKTVHFLVLNHDNYIPGNADSAENGYFQRSETSYHDIAASLPDNIPCYAAHPAEIPPPGQHVVLKRGKWDMTKAKAIHGFQLFNGYVDKQVRKSFSVWIRLLLNGRRQFLLAGNDSHGNMNRVREVKLPNVLLGEGRDHVLGYHRTGFLQTHDKNSVMNALLSGRSLVSNAYYVHLSLKDNEGCEYLPGDVCSPGAYTLNIKAVSTEEFGFFRRVRVYLGDTLSGRETCVLKENGASLHYHHEKEIHIGEKGYVRAEVTDRYHWTRFAFSNPVWIG